MADSANPVPDRGPRFHSEARKNAIQWPSPAKTVPDTAAESFE